MRSSSFTIPLSNVSITLACLQGESCCVSVAGSLLTPGISSLIFYPPTRTLLLGYKFLLTHLQWSPISLLYMAVVSIHIVIFLNKVCLTIFNVPQNIFIHIIPTISSLFYYTIDELNMILITFFFS